MLSFNSPAHDSSHGGAWNNAPSKTNTCYHLKYSLPHENYPSRYPQSSSIPPLELYCNYLSHVPLESLHLAVKVTVPSHSLTSESENSNGLDHHGGDIQYGHCTLDFYRVCKTAINRFNEEMNMKLSNADGEEAEVGERSIGQAKRKLEKTRISIARQLTKEGVPLYSIDRSTMEVRQSTISVI